MPQEEVIGNIYKNIAVLPVQNMYAVYEFEETGIHAERVFGIVLSQVKDDKNDYCSLTLITQSTITDSYVQLEDSCYDENIIGLIDNNENPFKSIEDIKNSNFFPINGFTGFDNKKSTE